MPSPNPNWKPLDKIAPPFSGMIDFDPAKMTVPELYKLMIGGIVPRPIAFISTKGADGSGNLAPFSFFNGVSSNPPCLMFSVSRKPDGTEKDTLRNILETKEFVINIANEWLIEPLVYSARVFPYGVNEMELVGLTPIPSVKVKVPRVKESAVHFECSLYDTLKVGKDEAGGATIVVGRIEYLHVGKECCPNGRILPEKLKPVGRLGGISYATLGDIFDIPVG